MLQRFRLDRRVGAVYLGLVLAGCHSSPPVLLPAGLTAADSAQVAGWVAATTPKGGALHRFGWHFQDEQADKGGRGAARVAAPDTLRFDFAGSLGIGKGSAMVVRDAPVWVVPERSVEDLVPSFPLLWAMIGVAMPPKPGDRLSGLEQGDRTAWRYANGADTVEYLRVAGNPVAFSSEVRHAGKVVGRTRITLRPDGSLVKAELLVPSAPAKLEITYSATAPAPTFPPDTWARPQP
ncbi:MAG: hypothetical protein U0133_03650 [Gemmatimonadales bacterium]